MAILKKEWAGILNPQLFFNTTLWAGLCSSLVFLFISCNPCWERIPRNLRGSCTSIDTLRFLQDTFDKSGQYYIQPAYRCNQLIFDPSQDPLNADSVREGLKRKCFNLKRKCDCGPGFELWEYPSVEGIDVGTSVAQGPKVGVIGKEFLYNLVFDLSKPVAIDKADSNLVNVSNLNCPQSNAAIKIAVVDSGIDTQTNPSKNGLRKQNWSPYNLSANCMNNNNTNGITCVSGYDLIEPSDSNGHGTSVNGVIVGESSPNIKVNIPIQLLNVRITNGHTKQGDLFDALCGLYYALEQNPHIINISWGFEYSLMSSDAECIALSLGIERVFNQFFKEANVHNVTIVAGIGNNGDLLHNKLKFYPGSLACCHDNVISVGSTYDRDHNLMTFQPYRFSSFSNVSTIQDNMATVFVPGERIHTVYPKYVSIRNENPDPLRASGYVYQSGTSFAAPLVSRLVALMISNNPGLLPRNIKNYLVASATKSTGASAAPVPFYTLDVWDVANKSCLGKYNNSSQTGN